jgi:hypothetical protein
LEQAEPTLEEGTESPGEGRALRGGKRQYRDYRGPTEYREILKALGATLSDHDLTIRYYRERAIPYIIPFPTRPMPLAIEPLPEGLEVWSIGDPLENADWFQSVLSSPQVIPGFTTVQRTFGESPGSEPARQPLDLYLGVDCSGSMFNPQLNVSYPVLAGTIIALSALRVGARVKVVLSGEAPGRAISTDGFISREHDVLAILTDYLGTGYSFGIHRLRETFAWKRKPGDRLVHILIVSDHDIFSMLDQEFHGDAGWDIARDAAERAGGGATYALNMPGGWEPQKVARMKADGWQVHSVQNWEELVAFARAFSLAKYGVAAAAQK